ncbi:unnamed protein product [Paramecium primaurelia]|uniref:RING-type E3 ubiquitin transferase n=1 Tax=Paramecium primaurelia TaxID=5886 RepID=A0A8S1PF92_PARPR|nr:unnamed protein product [Paramecium primaurelia]
MDIQKLIDVILNAAKQQDIKQDFELVQLVLNLTDSEFEEKILKLKGTGSKSVCSAPLSRDILFYKCFDCSKEPTHVYCQECYIPEKHQNHVVTYHYSNGGCCDCGDTLVMKKKSFCYKHSQQQIQIPVPEKLLGKNLAERYRQFIMVSFALLFERTQKIVDYNDKTMKQTQNAIQNLKLENSVNFMKEIMTEFLQKENILKECQKLYALIFKILNFITSNNIPWSYATSKFLQIPIDQDIQKFIILFHAHSKNQFEKFKLEKKQQICQCTILNLFVKHNVFFSRFIKEDANTISELFYELHVDENFKPYLCKQILIHYNHLYNPIQVYKLITVDNIEMKFKFNTINYSEHSKLNELIPLLMQNENVKKIYCKNKVERASLFGYFYQFMGHIVLSLLSLYKEYHSSQYYCLFDIFTNQLLQLPLCNEETQNFCQQFDDMILSQFYDDVVKKLFEQISEILSLEAEQFKFSPILPNNPKFNYLQNNSLLIYALTKIYPCQQTETSTFHFLHPQEKIKFQASEIIQIFILQGYRKLLSVVVDTWNEVNKQNKVGLQNIFRLTINYYLNNYVTSFSLKAESTLKNYLLNIVICDRNFITLLSLFLMDYNDPQEAYEELLKLSGLSSQKLRQVMLKLLRRTLLNNILLLKNGNPFLYKGQIKIYKEQIKLKEVSLEQVDVAYIQLYAFLFGPQGINDIISSYKEIAIFFNYKSDPSFLICRIAQTDYDLIQCVGDIFGNDLPDQFQKGLNKLFQTIFFAQSFYQENELRELLKKFSYDSSQDLQKIILSSCELNQDNQQLQLKKSLLPVQYEPVFASLVLELKEQITDKLKTQNDKQSELFGTALANELDQLNQLKSTLTYKRLAILKAIACDTEQQILQQILEQLQVQQEQGLIKNISQVLEDYSVYINLVYLCNKHLKNNNANLPTYLSAISQICFQILQDVNLTQQSNSIYEIFARQLDETLCLNPLQFESDAQRACRSQIKRKYYQQKFNNMGSGFSNQIAETPTQLITENCSLCQLQFEKEEIQYRALLIQYSNIHKHIHMIPKPIKNNLQIDMFEVVASSCQHTFHKQCLQQNEQKFTIGLFKYLKCPICLSPYNFPFVNPMYITNAKDQILIENLEFFLQTLTDQKVMQYYKRYSVEELNIPQLLDEIFSQVLCNLLFQLLSDLNKFHLKNNHLLLQAVLALLRIIYQENKTTILQEIVENDQEILFSILNLLLQNIIKQNNIKDLKQGLDVILYENPNKSAIIQALTENLIISQIQQKSLPYDIERISQDLKQNYIEKFQSNFKEFLIKHYLSPCQKKQCRFLPLQRMQNQEQNQYICLICLKKMCAHFCGRKSNKNIGNLSRHCIKKHNGKTMYLNLKNSEIIIMQSPFITLNNNPLYKNLIGELPFLGYYQSSHYEKFKLNLKALDQIIEIIIQDKYVHKLFQNSKKVSRTIL